MSPIVGHVLGMATSVAVSVVAVVAVAVVGGHRPFDGALCIVIS